MQPVLFLPDCAASWSGSRRRVETLAIRVKPRIFKHTSVSYSPWYLNSILCRNASPNIAPESAGSPSATDCRKKRNDESKKPPKAQPVDYITGEFLTNRSGTISRSKPDPKQPLIWLYIRSGKALVANVPYLPGIDPLRSRFRFPMTGFDSVSKVN